jgi:hypothetical protein
MDKGATQHAAFQDVVAGWDLTENVIITRKYDHGNAFDRSDAAIEFEGYSSIFGGELNTE